MELFPIKIRKAEECDAAILLHIYNDSYTVFDVPPQDILEVFEEMIRTEQTYILYAQGKASGFASFTVKDTHIFISALYILCRKQRRGLGSILLYMIEEKARQNGMKYLILKALKQFDWPITFYQKHDFLLYTVPVAENEQSIPQMPFITADLQAKAWEIIMIKEILNV